MSYESARTFEIVDEYSRRLGEFVKVYKKGRPTIVLLPGGMGSQLDQSSDPYTDDTSVPFHSYDTVWIDLGLIFDQDALKLEIQADLHDLGNHIVVPNGEVRFIETPYTAAGSYFRGLEYNYVVFGFDWRRPISESAGFLQAFLRRMRDRVVAAHGQGEDPLPMTTLVCHSMGGLVATMFLHRVFGSDTQPADVQKWMDKVVTVGTPFYGTATHMDRYYVGDPMLNILYGAQAVARLVGTLPGPYILLFPDKDTYHRDGAALGLARYPVRDSENGPDADPYDAASFTRYPSSVSQQFLADARAERHTVTLPLPDAVSRDRVFHLRAQNTDTRVEIYWPDSGTPIAGKPGPGDGTVPFWAARLAQTPLGQVYALTMAADHMALMEHCETLEVIRKIVEDGRVPPAVTCPDQSLATSKAPRDDVRHFLEGVKAGTVAKTDAHARDKTVWRRIIEEARLC